MEQRHGAIKLILRLEVAGGRKMHGAEPFARRDVLMLLREATACRKNQYAGPKDSRAQHARPSVKLTADCSARGILSGGRICLGDRGLFLEAGTSGTAIREPTHPPRSPLRQISWRPRIALSTPIAALGISSNAFVRPQH